MTAGQKTAKGTMATNKKTKLKIVKTLRLKKRLGGESSGLMRQPGKEDRSIAKTQCLFD